jgi:hypothetical protein
MIDAIADGFDLAEVRKALAHLESHSVRDTAAIRQRLLARWAELEPKAAFQYALASGSVRTIGSVITTWARTDADAVEAAVAEINGISAQRAVRGLLISAVSESDPRRAYAMLRQSRMFSPEGENVFRSWSKLDPQEAAEHAAELPEPWTRTVALSTAGEAWARVDRAAALEWAHPFSPAKPPGATIEVVESGPVAGVLQVWLREDADAALEWLEQLPEDALKAGTLTTLSKLLSSAEPEHAVQVGAMISDSTAKADVLYTAIGNWAQKDFSGALAWRSSKRTNAFVRSYSSAWWRSFAGATLIARWPLL